MLQNFAETLLGLSLKPQQLDVWRVGLRAIVVYLAMIVFVRFGKKRFLSRATAFDAILVIVIGSTAARAITGNAPFFETLAAVFVLIALHWIISFITSTAPVASAVVSGHSAVLIRNGRVDRKALKRAHMSDDDLAEDLREEGVEAPSKVKEARLERSGKVSVVRK